MIYFVQAAAGGPIKIGTSSRLSQRLAQLRAEHKAEFRVLAVADGGYPEETELHRRFSHLRCGHREWFEPSRDLLAFIHDATPWDGKDDLAPYSFSKLDADILPLAKAAAALAGQTVQEWLSDVANGAASNALGRKPVKRLPPKKREY